MPDLTILPMPDMIALALTLVAWLGIGFAVEHPMPRRPSVSRLMESYRREWMAQFVTRDPRVFDGMIIDSLRQSTAFFASATMIAVGGGLAVVANPAVVSGLTSDLPLSGQSVDVRLQGLLVVAFLVNALLKFVWSNRLFGYCAVIMASVPNQVMDPIAAPRAAQAAELNITAAKSFNSGLRSVYFALGSLGWLFGPYGLILAVVLTSLVLIRRDFASVSRTIILDGR